MYYAIAGAVGGLIKSLLEHNGSIKLPSKEDGAIALGVFVDIIGGAAFGYVATDKLVLDIFEMTAPSYAFSFMVGLAWLAIIQTLLARLGIGNGIVFKSRNNPNSGMRPLMLQKRSG